MKPLTEKQKQILGEVLKGYQNKEIARNLGISESTVKMHVHIIYQKYEVRNERQLMAMFIDKKKAND